MAKIKVTSEAAVKEINNLITGFNALKKSVGGVQAKAANFKKMEAALKGITTTSKNLTHEFAALTVAYKNMSASQKNYVTQTRNLKTKLKEAKDELKKMNKELKNAQTNTKKTSNGFKGMAVSLGRIMAAFGVIGGLQLFASVAKNVFETTKTFDALGFAMEKITGNALIAADSMRFLVEITQDFGTELVSTSNRWIKFLAAAKQSGLTTAQTEDIFRSMTKAAGVLGLKTDELTGIYLALEQMLSKGKVTTEELRRQLGERLPGAMGIMAASLGVTISKLDEMLKKGQILSAEVLPNFARAVELAYGIDTLERVDTLVAAQNRLTTAWQKFVKNVFTDSTFLKKVFNGLALYIGDIEIALGGVNAIKNAAAADATKSLRKELLKQAIDEIDANNGAIGRYQELVDKKNEIKKKSDNIQRKGDDFRNLDTGEVYTAKQYNDEKKALKLQQEELQRLITEYAIEANKIIKDKAASGLADAQDNYDKQVKRLEDFEKRKAEILKKTAVSNYGAYEKVPSRDAAVSEEFKDDPLYFDVASDKVQGKIDTIQDLTAVIAAQAIEAGKAEAKLATYFKLVEETDTENIIVPDDKPKTTSKRGLKNIVLKEEELQIAVLKARKKGNEDLIELDELSSIKQLELAELNAAARLQIAELEQKIILRDGDAQRVSKLDSLKKQYDENKILAKDGLTVLEQVAKQEFLIEEEYRLLKETAEADFNKKIISLERTSSNEKLDIIKKEQERQLLLIEKPYREKEIALKNELRNEETTAKRKKEIIIELANLAIEMEDAKKDAIILTLKAQIKALQTLEQGGAIVNEKIKEIIALIKQIEASKGVPKDGEKSKEFWNNLLSYALDYSAAIGDIVDGVFQSRIEKINAEIEAEEYKYARLLELADGDAEAQKTLRRNQEIGRKQLEKKRLKEEQKQAKARKAFAVADIGIQTALALVRAKASTAVIPFPGNIAAYALESALILGLSALQTAAVLAAPIPKYKDGLENAKTDHLGMINDGGRQEYIERGGNILTTTSKNAIVPLIAGDTIHKSYDDLKRKSMIMTGLYSGVDLTESKFNRLFDGINESITKGFSKAKVNNKIKLVGLDAEHKAYGDSMSRWD